MKAVVSVAGMSTNGKFDLAVNDAERWAARVAGITVEDVPALLGPTDHTMALFFERFYKGQLHTSPQFGVKAWNGLIWEDDATHGRHRDAAITTVETLIAAADTVTIPAGLLAARNDSTTSLEETEAGIRREMRSGLKRWEMAGRLNAMIEMAGERTPFLADIASFDQDPLALTVANGVLDLRDTATLTPASSERRLTKALNIAYDPEAPCPRFEKFLAEIFPKDTTEVTTFIQKYVGSCLTGIVKDHVLPIWWGEGANGKTTFLTVLQALLGPFAQVAPLSLLLESKQGGNIPNDIARLKGARLVVTSETPEHVKLAEATVKALTGGDRLVGRFLHKEFFEFDPTHKVLLITNHKPVIRGQDHAIWRRLALVPFTVKFWKPEENPPVGAPLQDPELAATLLRELPGVLRWAVEGCLAWQREGLHLPAIVRVATAEYRAEQDVLKPFLDECCVIDPQAWVATDELYAKYKSWADAAHERPMSKKALGMELGKRGYASEKEADVRGRKGLSLR